MAIGTPTTPILMVGGATATSFNTGDYTPPANCVLVTFIGARGASSTEPTISDTGATWSVVTGSYADAGGAKGKLWYLDVGGTPPTLNTTITSTGATQVAIEVADFPGGAVNLSNVRTGTSVTGDPAVSPNFAAFGASSACVGFSGVSGGDARTPPTGYTELNDNAPATNLRMHAWYDLTSPAVAMGITGAGASGVVCGVEIVEAAAGTVTGTFNQTVDAVTQSASGDVLIQATAAQTIADVTLAAVGSSGSSVNGTFTQTIAPVTQSASADLLVQGTFGQTISPITLAANGSAPAGAISGTFNQTIAAVALSATGSEQTYVMPATPWYGTGGHIPRDQLDRAVKELLRKKKGRKPVELARKLVAAIEIGGLLGQPERKAAVAEIARELPAQIPALFTPARIDDTAAIQAAIERIVQDAVARIAQDAEARAIDEDEEDIEWLLLAA